MKLHTKQKNERKSKVILKLFSFMILLALSFTFFTLNTSASEASDYKVVLTTPTTVSGGETFEISVDIVDISYPENGVAEGIYGASVFLYYDSDYLTPVSDSFSAVAPTGWDKFNGAETKGIYAFYAVFNGLFTNGATEDGEISFKVSFAVKDAEIFDVNTAFYIQGCECIGYDENAMFKTSEFISTAFCNNPLTIKAYNPLIPEENNPFAIDYENNIIYSETEGLTYDNFVSSFKLEDSVVSITAFDYEVTSENKKVIPNGAKITVTNSTMNKSYEFTYYLLGDCNCDGSVTIADLAIIKTVIVQRLPAEGHVKYAMELEKDGVVRLSDYLRLKRYIITK